MSQVIVNPDEIRIFMSELQQFKNDLQNNQQSIIAKLDYLGETWQDQGHQRFQEDFFEMMRSMESLMTRIDEYTSDLNRKAEMADELNNYRF